MSQMYTYIISSRNFISKFMLTLLRSSFKAAYEAFSVVQSSAEAYNHTFVKSDNEKYGIKTH